METSVHEAISHAEGIANSSMLPQTVYRNEDSGGWWHTNALAPLLAKAELNVTILPVRYFN